MVVYSWLSVLCYIGITWAQDIPDGATSMKFTMPDLSDEEQHSSWVPDQMKCDACQAVVYQLWTNFNKFNDMHKYKKYNLPESDILEITEEVCSNIDLFNSYGIKKTDNGHHLTGPGIESTDKPGVIAGGGKWAGRLLDMCDQFMGRVGEDKVYNVYKKDPKTRVKLEDFLCRGPSNTVRGECTKVTEVKYEGDASPVFGAKKHQASSDDDDDDDDEHDRDEF